MGEGSGTGIGAKQGRGLCFSLIPNRALEHGKYGGGPTEILVTACHKKSWPVFIKGALLAKGNCPEQGTAVSH